MKTPTLLNQPQRIAALDPSGMLQNILDIPFHCQDARYRVLNHPPKLNANKIPHVIFAGLGGSAIGGDILRTLIWKSIAFSLSVNRHYELPGWAGKDSLVVCSSYSGNTEETLSVFKQALQRKAQILVISSGGELLAQAKKKKLPFCQVPGGLPPRAAAPGYSFVTLLTALESAGLIRSYEEDFQESMGLLVDLARQYGQMNPTSKNPAKQLASFLHGKLPLLYAGQDHFESAALRWRGQLNENSKQVALMNMVPEMNHNEILGFTHKDTLLKKVGVIFLRHPQGDHPQIQKRFEILKGVLGSKVAGVREVKAQGRSLLAQMLSVIYLGDFVSLYLAYLKGLDPTEMGLIEELKKKLSRHK